MRLFAPTLRRALGIVIACTLLLVRGAAAEFAPVDLDGDGHHDQLTVEHSEPSAIRVWLSKSDTTHFIRTPVPVVTLIAIDLDGDRRPELIARDSGFDIHVWKWRRKRTAFRAFGRSSQPRVALPVLLESQHGHSIDDEEREPAGALSPTPLSLLALIQSPSPRSPDLQASTPTWAVIANLAATLTTHQPFAPRPPPATAHLHL